MRTPFQSRPSATALGLAVLAAPIMVAFIIALFPAPSTGNVQHSAAPAPAEASVSYADTMLEVELTRPAAPIRYGYVEFENAHGAPSRQIVGLTAEEFAD